MKLTSLYPVKFCAALCFTRTFLRNVKEINVVSISDYSGIKFKSSFLVSS